MIQVLRLTTSSMTIAAMISSRKPSIWVMALLKRAGKKARKKTQLLTDAGTTAEGVQDEVVRSLAQGLVHASLHIPS